MPQKFLNYEVLERLGEGAGSVIYAVIDPNTKQVYALKHVPRVEPKDIRFVEQMKAEYEVSKAFSHPNLRKSFDYRENKTLFMKVTEAFLVMEMIDAKPLDVRPPNTIADIVDSFIQASSGLKAMHSMGYAHCDIKPNNIMRSATGHIKVIDYGQSCKIGTVKERIQGTPDYIAPEQVSRRPISIQTDVFNLGATLYWILTGKNIPTLYTVNKKGENSFLLDAAIVTPADLNAKVPQPLSNLVMEMVATKLQKRPSDMDEVITRLELVNHVLQKQAAVDAANAAAAIAAEASAPAPPDSDMPRSSD